MSSPPLRPRAASRRVFGIVLVLVLVVLAFANWARPYPAATWKPGLKGIVTVGTSAPVVWPPGAESAVGLTAQGVLAASPTATSKPIASVAKVMTALLTLRAHPLAIGEPGPEITVSQADVATYLAFVAEDGSVVPVVAGESLTEYQALQALLLPSADNIAILLARWVAGTEGSFVAQMNEAARELGMEASTFTDPSGYDPGTVSTPSDLIRLAQAALALPVLAQVVGQQTATLPVAGQVSNVNRALGVDGIVGIKTGNTPEAGAVFLFAAQNPAPGGEILGAIEGMATLSQCFQAAQQLIDQVRSQLVPRQVVAKGAAVGTLTTAWGAKTRVAAFDAIELTVWPGTEVTLSYRLTTVSAPTARGHRIGILTASAWGEETSSELTAAAALPSPSAPWRILRGA